jgi:hypothetical protein
MADSIHELRNLVQFVICGDTPFAFPGKDCPGDKDIKPLGNKDCYDTNEAWPAQKLPNENNGDD